MPYKLFYEECRKHRYDLELLQHTFSVSFEQVAHRVTCLQDPKMKGIPFHMLRTDIAGNISKRLSLSGIQIPRYGGANEAALNMLKKIGSVKNIPEFIKRAKDPNDNFRLMGFGHRVYKNYDPRAKVMQKACHEVLEVMGKKDDELLKVAIELEKIALNDDYFVQKKLYPNIDFYSGITLSAMGFSTEMFVVLFAVARTSGWIAHWKEMYLDPSNKLSRPRQLYLGEVKRDFIDIAKR